MRNKANSSHSRHHGTDTDGSVCHTESAPHPNVSSSISTNASKGLKASADVLLINRQGETEVEAPRDLDERLRNLKSWCRAKSIKQNKEKFQPVTFARKALTSAERKYSQSEWNTTTNMCSAEKSSGGLITSLKSPFLGSPWHQQPRRCNECCYDFNSTTMRSTKSQARGCY